MDLEADQRCPHSGAHSRLVLVTGSCPGAGKSTHSETLVSTLVTAGVPARLHAESDLLASGLFTRFDDELFRSEPEAIETLIEAAADLARVVGSADATHIVDALLPGWFWLLGRYPTARVEEFTQELGAVLRLLQPMIVYLSGNVDILFARAVSQRGNDWSAEFVRAVGRWQLPFYPSGPVRTPDDMLQLFAWLDQESRRLLTRWSGDSLLLKATSSADQLAMMVKRATGVERASHE